MDVLYPGSQLHNPTLDLNDPEKKKQILKEMDGFILRKPTITQIKEVFERELNLGLLTPKSCPNETCLQMEPTFISNLPDGHESGDFLSIDLGSTNFRVLLSRLHSDAEDEFIVKYYDVPKRLRTGESRWLFDFLATCISDFINMKTDLKEKPLPLGFTFSYPMNQEAIDAAYLITWTKSYDLPDAIGQNAVELLRDAIKRQKGLDNIEVVVILNDTTGTLVKGSYIEPTCGIGLILGSGFNACYLEKVSRIHKLSAKQLEALKDVSEMVVDIECGAFGDNGCIDFVKTPIDRQLDQESLFVNSFSFEKLFSGNFLGDVVRRILLSLAQKRLLFDGKVARKLQQKDSFKAAHVVDFEGASNDESLQSLLKASGCTREPEEEATSEDVAIIRFVCAVVSVRAAILVSVLLSALIQRMDKEMVTVAIDGSLFKYHPKLNQLLHDFIRLLAPGRQFKIVLAEDGSGKGAGLAAAMTQKLR